MGKRQSATLSSLDNSKAFNWQTGRNRLEKKSIISIIYEFRLGPFGTVLGKWLAPRLTL